jgi:hypothetical protein
MLIICQFGKERSILAENGKILTPEMAYHINQLGKSEYIINHAVKIRFAHHDTFTAVRLFVFCVLAARRDETGLAIIAAGTNTIRAGSITVMIHELVDDLFHTGELLVSGPVKLFADL